MFDWLKKRKETKFKSDFLRNLNPSLMQPKFLEDFEKGIVIYDTDILRWTTDINNYFESLKINNPEYIGFFEEEKFKILSSVYSKLLYILAEKIKRHYDFYSVKINAVKLNIKELEGLFDHSLISYVSNDSREIYIKMKSSIKEIYEKSGVYDLLFNSYNILKTSVEGFSLSSDSNRFQSSFIKSFTGIKFGILNKIAENGERSFVYYVFDYIKNYLDFADAYLQYYFKIYIQKASDNVSRHEGKNAEDKLILEYNNLINSKLDSIKRNLDKIILLFPDSDLYRNQVLSKFDFIVKEARKRNLAVIIEHKNGVEVIVEGYENNDQEKIKQGVLLIKDGPQLYTSSDIDNIYLFHTVSNKPFGATGSWDAFANSEFVINPEDYVDRLVSIFREGLKPSLRKDSQFNDDKLSELQEVFFYKTNGLNDIQQFYQNKLLYGSFGIVFKPGRKYALFEGVIPIGGNINLREYFILSKVFLKDDFKLIYFEESFRTKEMLNVIIDNNYSRNPRTIKMTYKEYVQKVQDLLKKRGITFTTLNVE